MTPNIDKIVEACKRLPEQRHWSTECPKQFFMANLRLIDVLEGRQKLGKPEEEGENNEQ